MVLLFMFMFVNDLELSFQYGVRKGLRFISFNTYM